MVGEILRDPKEVPITDGNGKSRTFILTKMTAWDGLEIMSRFPISMATSTIPKIGDWGLVQELQIKIMKYVAVDLNGVKQILCTQALIDNHCGDWECLSKLIIAEVEYNNSFFRDGKISSFFADLAHQYLAKVSEILNKSSEPSSAPEKPLSTNSGQSTR